MLMLINYTLFLLSLSAFSFSKMPIGIYGEQKRARGGAGKRKENGTRARAWLNFHHFGERRMSSTEDD